MARGTQAPPWSCPADANRPQADAGLHRRAPKGHQIAGWHTISIPDRERHCQDARTGDTMLHASVPLIDHRHEMTGALATAAWALRSNVTFYDGLYVALAVALAAPLLTADERLSRALALGCAVELVGTA
jgi:hypothetical protein